MKIIVCIDDNNGLLFNKRRVSSDIAVIDRIVDTVGQNKLWVTEYSAALFKDKSIKPCVSNNLLNEAEAEDYCFIENTDITDCISQITEITVYHWNRRYPSDFKFPKQSAIKGKACASSVDFKGNSHEKITEEIYK